mgnify:CR=1 FL=1
MHVTDWSPSHHPASVASQQATITRRRKPNCVKCQCTVDCFVPLRLCDPKGTIFQPEAAPRAAEAPAEATPDGDEADGADEADAMDEDNVEADEQH